MVADEAGLPGDSLTEMLLLSAEEMQETGLRLLLRIVVAREACFGRGRLPFGNTGGARASYC